MRGQGVGRGHGVHGHGGVGRVGHGLRKHQVRVGVDAPAGRVEAVEERVHGAGVGIAERRGPDGILGAGRGQGAVFGHQRLDGEAALGRGLEHAVRRPRPPVRCRSRGSLQEGVPGGGSGALIKGLGAAAGAAGPAPSCREKFPSCRYVQRRSMEVRGPRAGGRAGG